MDGQLAAMTESFMMRPFPIRWHEAGIWKVACTHHEVRTTNWIDDFIAVGGLEDAFSVKDLKEGDIDLIIDARRLFDGISGINVVPIVDKVLKAGNMLVMLTPFDTKVLVHCLMGIDRTPFLAMVYVSKKYDMPYKEAYEFVKKKNPYTVFHWDWVEMLGTRVPSGTATTPPSE